MENTQDEEKELEQDAQHVTSAITDMSVADVRKSLSFVRKEWQRHSSVMPFFTSQLLPSTQFTISEFTFLFVMGHHHKRHQKSLAVAPP